jgi:hypothetical protein
MPKRNRGPSLFRRRDANVQVYPQSIGSCWIAIIGIRWIELKEFFRPIARPGAANDGRTLRGPETSSDASFRAELRSSSHCFRALPPPREGLFSFFDVRAGAAHIDPGDGDLVMPSAISRTCDETHFMIAAVSTWGPSELTLERPVESGLRLIPNVAGDFRDTSRCPFK